MKPKVELTFLRVDEGTGSLIYKGSDGDIYIEVEGVIHDLTEEGEPLAPFRNYIIKAGEPIYNPADRFGRNVGSKTQQHVFVNDGSIIPELDWKNFTLNHLNAFLKYWSVGNGDIEIMSFIPQGGEPTLRIDYAKVGEKNLSVGDVGKQFRVVRGSENLYLDITVYDDDNKAFVVSIFTKENHKGLKEIQGDLIQKFKNGGLIQGEKVLYLHRPFKGSGGEDESYIEYIIKDTNGKFTLVNEAFQKHFDEGYSTKEELMEFHGIQEESLEDVSDKVFKLGGLIANKEDFEFGEYFPLFN